MELAFYHSVRREGPECEAAARAALAMEPDNHAAWSMLGTALLLQERWISAGDAFRRALEINPSHERSRQGLALAHRGEAAASTAP
jgi:cytochrome c-type biogenesis protein CcmH/NrfG